MFSANLLTPVWSYLVPFCLTSTFKCRPKILKKISEIPFTCQYLGTKLPKLRSYLDFSMKIRHVKSLVHILNALLQHYFRVTHCFDHRNIAYFTLNLLRSHLDGSKALRNCCECNDLLAQNPKKSAQEASIGSFSFSKPERLAFW